MKKELISHQTPDQTLNQLNGLINIDIFYIHCIKEWQIGNVWLGLVMFQWEETLKIFN